MEPSLCLAIRGNTQEGTHKRERTAASSEPGRWNSLGDQAAHTTVFSWPTSCTCCSAQSSRRQRDTVATVPSASVLFTTASWSPSGENAILHPGAPLSGGATAAATLRCAAFVVAQNAVPGKAADHSTDHSREHGRDHSGAHIQAQSRAHRREHSSSRERSGGRQQSSRGADRQKRVRGEGCGPAEEG